MGEVILAAEAVIRIVIRVEQVGGFWRRRLRRARVAYVACIDHENNFKISLPVI